MTTGGAPGRESALETGAVTPRDFGRLITAAPPPAPRAGSGRRLAQQGQHPAGVHVKRAVADRLEVLGTLGGEDVDVHVKLGAALIPLPARRVAKPFERVIGPRQGVAGGAPHRSEE